MVSMDAFQAFDPGSIPGRRTVFFSLSLSSLLLGPDLSLLQVELSECYKAKDGALCGNRTHAFREDYDLNVAP